MQNKSTVSFDEIHCIDKANILVNTYHGEKGRVLILKHSNNHHKCDS